MSTKEFSITNARKSVSKILNSAGFKKYGKQWQRSINNVCQSIYLDQPWYGGEWFVGVTLQDISSDPPRPYFQADILWDSNVLQFQGTPAELQPLLHSNFDSEEDIINKLIEIVVKKCLPHLDKMNSIESIRKFVLSGNWQGATVYAWAMDRYGYKIAGREPLSGRFKDYFKPPS